MSIKKIGVVATSAPGSSLSQASLELGINFFKSKGIEIIFSEEVLTSLDYVSTTVENRIASIQTFASDSTIDIIMNFWGGHQTHQLLPESRKLFESNKALVGYSDITPLINWLAENGNHQCFLGPAFISFCKPVAFEYSWNNLLSALSGDSFEVQAAEKITTNRWYNDNGMVIKDSEGWQILSGGKATGKSLGGNMGALLLTAGTPYWPDMKNSILFLEDDESESIETIDRFLTQFQQIGVFDQCAGIVLGRYMDGVFDSQIAKVDLYRRVFEKFDGPVIYDVDFGHSDPIFTIPLGRTVSIDAKGKYPRIIFEKI